MGTNTFCRKIKNSVQLASHIGKSFNINQQWWFAKGEKGSKYQEVGKGSSTRVIKNVLRKKKVFNAPQYKEKSEEDQKRWQWQIFLEHHQQCLHDYSHWQNKSDNISTTQVTGLKIFQKNMFPSL